MLFTEYYYLAYKNVHLKFSHTTTYRKGKYYRKSFIKPPGGAYLFQAYLRAGGGVLNRDGGAYLRGGGGLFNLETAMVSVLQKGLEYKVERLKYKTFEVMQPRIRIKSDLPVGK